MANYKTIMVIVGDWCDYGLINYITKEVVPPASGPGAWYHGVAQKGLWYPTAPWCGAGGRSCVSWEGTLRPPAPGRGVVVPISRLRREIGTTSLPRSANQLVT